LDKPLRTKRRAIIGATPNTHIRERSRITFAWDEFLLYPRPIDPGAADDGAGRPVDVVVIHGDARRQSPREDEFLSTPVPSRFARAIAV
jgi:hypothetical protein